MATRYQQIAECVAIGAELSGLVEYMDAEGEAAVAGRITGPGARHGGGTSDFHAVDQIVVAGEGGSLTLYAQRNACGGFEGWTTESEEGT